MSADQAEASVDLKPRSNSGTNRDEGRSLSKSDSEDDDAGPEDEETPQNIYKTIRLAKADLENFSNFDPANIPDTLEKTQAFIERFIEQKNKTRKRKLDDQDTSSGMQRQREPQYEKLSLKPEQEAKLGTSSQDFKLLIFHSKHVSLCLGQEFTTKLVQCSDGDIVTKTQTSSLIYFFYRILESIKKPEIIIITMGHTWRLANELACESFSSSIKEKDLEDEAVSQKVLHTSGGPVLSTEQHARGGKTLRPSTFDTPGDMEQKSTRYPKSNAALNRIKALKKGSRIYLSKTSFSAHLSLDIEHLHQFIKYVAETSQIYQSEKIESLQEVENKNLLEQLDKELLKRLTAKDSKNQYCTSSFLQHEDTEEWNNATELRLHIPDTKTRRHDLPLSFNVIVRELTEHKIREVDWLETIKISWTRNKGPVHKEPLKHFLEDYVRVDGVFYRYLFGKWLTITYEYATEKDRQFKEIMVKDFLEASLDFPILPWLHKDKKDDEKQTEKTTQNYNIQSTSSSRKDTHLTPARQIVDSQNSGNAISQDSGTGDSQSSGLDRSPLSSFPRTHFAQANQTADSQDSGTVVSQSPAFGQPATSSSPRTDTHLTPASQTADNQNSGTGVSQSPAPSRSSHSKTRKKKASVNQDFQHDSISLGVVCKQSGIRNEMKNFTTEGIELEKSLKMIHYPVKVNLDKMLPGQMQADGSTKTMTYSLGTRRKVNQPTYFIPEEVSEVNELENLLFLRLNTKMSEGEYNDCHILLRRLLKCYDHERFIIIPGDELFVSGKNCELYDILISDEEQKITYIIHVKADFNQKTRDAYSQLHLSAQKIRSSLLYKSSTSALEQYWDKNARFGYTKHGYEKDVAFILSEMKKEKFLDLFNIEKRRLVFVFACRDSRKYILKQEAERGPLYDTHVSVENILRNNLKEQCHLKKISNSEKIITEVIGKLKQLKILNDSGQMTENYRNQTDEGKKPILREVTKIVPHGLKDFIKKSLKNCLPISNSDIAKFGLVNLKRAFQDLHVGEKQFELKICQIPMELYLNQYVDSMTDVNMSGDHATSS